MRGGERERVSQESTEARLCPRPQGLPGSFGRKRGSLESLSEVDLGLTGEPVERES